MCRFFVVRSAVALACRGLLVDDRNALAHQSREHPDGWGLACFDDDRVRLVRGTLPAHADPSFALAAHEARGRTVVAHVRKASVGGVTEKNTHPFVRGRWLFAHNGTLPDFASRQAELEALLHPDHRASLAGETDSERLFALLLTCLARRETTVGVVGLDNLHAALDETLALVNRTFAGQKRPSANLLVTDGARLAVCRQGRPLVMAVDASSVVIASERIGDGHAWTEIAEGEAVLVDDDLTVTRRTLPSAIVSREAA